MSVSTKAVGHLSSDLFIAPSPIGQSAIADSSVKSTQKTELTFNKKRKAPDGLEEQGIAQRTRVESEATRSVVVIKPSTPDTEHLQYLREAHARQLEDIKPTNSHALSDVGSVSQALNVAQRLQLRDISQTYSSQSTALEVSSASSSSSASMQTDELGNASSVQLSQIVNYVFDTTYTQIGQLLETATPRAKAFLGAIINAQKTLFSRNLQLALNHVAQFNAAPPVIPPITLTGSDTSLSHQVNRRSSNRSPSFVLGPVPVFPKTASLSSDSVSAVASNPQIPEEPTTGRASARKSIVFAKPKIISESPVFLTDCTHEDIDKFFVNLKGKLSELKNFIQRKRSELIVRSGAEETAKSISSYSTHNAYLLELRSSIEGFYGSYIAANYISNKMPRFKENTGSDFSIDKTQQLMNSLEFATDTLLKTVSDAHQEELAQYEKLKALEKAHGFFQIKEQSRENLKNLIGLESSALRLFRDIDSFSKDIDDCQLDP